MTHSLAGWIAGFAALLAACGVGYYALCLYGAFRFRQAGKHKLADFSAPVSILKPLRGTDPEIYQSFRSHCLQDYPEFEIIFGVSDPDDPAVPLVQQLQREFPERRIELIVCEQVLGTNLKVSNLLQMLPAARYEYLIVNDSDICVPRDYLRQVLAPFASQKVGLVTCLYRGQAAHTLGSKLEAIGISTEFHPGVLVAQQVEGGIHFALGSTLAFSRESLAAIGGFETLVDYLADDYELGARISQAGYRVELSPVIVDTHLPAYSFSRFFEHQLRWGRSTRNSRPAGYFGLALTFGLPWALIALLASHWTSHGTRWAPVWSWALLAAVLASRLAVTLYVGWSVLRDRQVFSDLWLVPVRDLIGLVLWICSYTGSTVAWRGDQFKLKDGKLTPVDASF
jgi:ceramide glucosyltransferase